MFDEVNLDGVGVDETAMKELEGKTEPVVLPWSGGRDKMDGLVVVVAELFEEVGQLRVVVGPIILAGEFARGGANRLISKRGWICERVPGLRQPERKGASCQAKESCEEPGFGFCVAYIAHEWPFLMSKAGALASKSQRGGLLSG